MPIYSCSKCNFPIAGDINPTICPHCLFHVFSKKIPPHLQLGLFSFQQSKNWSEHLQGPHLFDGNIPVFLWNVTLNQSIDASFWLYKSPLHCKKIRFRLYLIRCPSHVSWHGTEKKSSIVHWLSSNCQYSINIPWLLANHYIVLHQYSLGIQ